MNTYYNFNEISNVEQSKSVSKHNTKKYTEKGLIALLYSLFLLVTSQKAIKISKVTVSVVCFIGFFGIIGGIENGSLGMTVGLLLCAAITAVEFLILKSFANADK